MCCGVFVGLDKEASCKECLAKALQLDTERNRPMKQLPTESELRREMEGDLLVFGKYFSNAKIDKYDSSMTLIISVCNTDVAATEREFRPDPVAPPKGDFILCRYKGEKITYVAISAGTFLDNGILLTHDGKRDDGSFIEENDAIDWCSATDRTNHSDGWKREWEPDFDGGAE